MGEAIHWVISAITSSVIRLSSVIFEIVDASYQRNISAISAVHK